MLYVSTNINLVLSSMGRECISSIVLSLISDILDRFSLFVDLMKKSKPSSFISSVVYPEKKRGFSETKIKFCLYKSIIYTLLDESLAKAFTLSISESISLYDSSVTPFILMFLK